MAGLRAGHNLFLHTCIIVLMIHCIGDETCMESIREERKKDHIAHAIATENKSSPYWDDIHLVHQALFDEDFNKIDTKMALFGKKLSFPLIINALTGGADGLEKINASLSRIAGDLQIGMAVGSQTAGITNREVRHTYEIARKLNPNGLILANVSALVKPETARAAVEMIEADALQLHLNGVQELLMTEGDRDFRGLAENIQIIAGDSQVPVIIKEVGFGMSRETALQLYNLGVQGLDIGGTGGTNFAAIELARRKDNLSHFKPLISWGIPTPLSLLEVMSLKVPLPVIASGGIKSPLEILKALVIGAQAAGIAGPFLKILVLEGEEDLRHHVEKLQEGLKVLMMAAGARNIRMLPGLPVVLLGDTLEWCKQRGFNITKILQKDTLGGGEQNE